MKSDETGVSLDFGLRKTKDGQNGKNVVWSAQLGSPTYGNPVVSQGKVLIGTNNGAEYREKHKGDRGVLLCFDENSGELLWQLTREKLLSGQVNDFPEQGICSGTIVEGDRAWVVTNRCELMCIDLEGFRDGENDGVVQDEPDHESLDGDIVWNLDMIESLGVFPHNLATSSPVIHGDRIFLVTGNGVDDTHLDIPSPLAPSFLAVNKNTGEVIWQQNYPLKNILHGQWSSPAIGEVNGKVQVYFAGGNGWIYALNPEDGGIIWQFDCNPKETKWETGGAGTRNEIIATPVFVDNSVVIGVGQDPEHGEGVGHFWRIDATKTGDVSAELGEINAPGKPNPNSGAIWHYGGVDIDGSVTGTAGQPVFRRTLSTAAVSDGLVFISDLSGFVHCLDFNTGKRHWEHDMLAAAWGSPMIVDGKVFIGNEDGKLVVFEATSEMANELGSFDTDKYSAVYSTPVFCNGHMYLSDRSRLYRVKMQGQPVPN